MPRFRHVTLLQLLLLAALLAPARAGELDPPGPPQPTMKTLVDVEPRTALRNQFDTLTPLVIDQPGSYYLAEDIYAFPNANGIEIAASNVTLDLNGFSVIGNLEVGSWSGIVAAAPATREGIVIKNGNVRYFLNDGINLVFAKFSRVENMNIMNNGLDGTGDGIRLDTGIVQDTMVAHHPGFGILGVAAIVVRCIAVDNDTGISAAVLSDSYAEANTGDGLRGSFSVIRDSTSVGNGGDGLECTDSLVMGNAIQGVNATNSTVIHNEIN